MKKLIAATAIALLAVCGRAQTNGLTISGSLGQLVDAVQASSLLQATNYAFSPYATYAPKAPTKIGGGILAIYNMNNYVGGAIGVDWLGGFSLVSGNITLKADTHPFANIGLLSWLPPSIKNVAATPFALVGVGTPFGSKGQGAATIWDMGYTIHFGHWLGGNFGAGATWGAWDNAGAYSGHRYHLFVEYQKGF